MKCNIHLFRNIEACREYFKAHREGLNTISWFSTGCVSEKDRSTLNNLGLKEITPHKYTESDKSDFIDSYLNVIGMITVENANNRLWWASQLSSRNRFCTRTVGYIQNFTEVADLLKDKNFDSLAVIGVPWQINTALKDNLGKSGFNFVEHNKTIIDKIQALTGRIKKLAGYFFHAFRMYCRAVYSRRCLKLQSNKHFLKLNPETMIRNFTYDHSFTKDGGYSDHFFGPLINDLCSKDTFMVTDVLGDFKGCVQKIKDLKHKTIIPFEYFLSLSDILSALTEVVFCKIKIPEHLQFNGYDIKKIINAELFETCNNIPIYQYLNHKAIKRMVLSLDVKRAIMPYENNPWERMCISALRESGNAYIVGYQHNVVPQASVNMFVGNAESATIPKPDRIVTTGLETKTIMHKYGNYDNTKIEPGCALRYSYLFEAGDKPFRGVKRILLGLEGIYEVYHIINYVYEQLAGLAEYEVVIRMHPVLPIEKIQDRLVFDINTSKQFTVSKGFSLKEDVDRSDVMIYWGSTVALEALWMGMPVIHFDNGNILSFDPLFNCGHLKWTVSSSTCLKSVLDEIQLLPSEEFMNRKNLAKDYLKQYFYPINKKNLSVFLA